MSWRVYPIFLLCCDENGGCKFKKWLERISDLAIVLPGISRFWIIVVVGMVWHEVLYRDTTLEKRNVSFS